MKAEVLDEDFFDLNRASWEGMTGEDDAAENSQELPTFSHKVKNEFLKKTLLLDIEEAATLITAGMGDQERKNLQNLLKHSTLRTLLENLLGEAEWKKIEAEEANRYLADDQYRNSTPG